MRIAGVDVGKVEGLKIEGDHVVMKFNVGSQSFGTESRLAVKTDTILGKKVLEIEARGYQTLRPGPRCRWAKHNALPDLRRVLRRHQGRPGLEH